MDNKKIKRALISVANKDGLLDLAKILVKNNVEILASDGTAKFLGDAGIESVKISEYTGFPEILGGRVKTLNPLIFAGILCKQEDFDHMNDLNKVNAKPIDLVIVDLYHFEENPSVEKIDIGGSALLRAAAKNFEDLVVIIDNKDYNQLIEEMKSGGETSRKFRSSLAEKAFKFSVHYDSMISNWFSKINNTTDSSASGESESDGLMKIDLSMGDKALNMRYGENPGQNAIFRNFANKGDFGFKQLCGKELSFNNILDAHAAIHLCYEFAPNPAIVIVKHNNPCCVAVGKTVFDAYSKAISTDKESSFGGIVASTVEVDEQTAKKIIEIFTEVVIAPAVSDDAMKVFKTKPNLRVIIFNDIKEISNEIDFKPALGGVLLQKTDYSINRENWKCVTKTRPTTDEFNDAEFAYRVSKHVKSNAIVFAMNKTAVAIGPGQTSRVQSTKIALDRLNTLRIQENDVKSNCQENNNPNDYSDDLPIAMDCLSSYYKHYDRLIMASDGFLPFPDSLEVAIEAGIKVVIQPGGSINDQKVIDKANKEGIAMIFTGQRVFKH
jgi:phosphoribosylaminoimidazolecarboxamide formyltransferase/IMP cyclohydrolase